MMACVRAAWPAAAAVAFAATAALAVTLTSRAPLHVSLIASRVGSSPAKATTAEDRHLRSGPPQCGLSRLDVSIAGEETARIWVDFTNISGTACTLTGYPQVSAYLAGGAQVGNAAAIDTSVSARLIVLAPGASAHAAIVDNASAGRCRLVAAAVLRVIPPGQSVPLFVHHVVTACVASGRTAPVFLHIRAIEPGTGVPVRTRADRPRPRPRSGQAPRLATRQHRAR